MYLIVVDEKLSLMLINELVLIVCCISFVLSISLYVFRELPLYDQMEMKMQPKKINSSIPDGKSVEITKKIVENVFFLI